MMEQQHPLAVHVEFGLRKASGIITVKSVYVNKETDQND